MHCAKFEKSITKWVARRCDTCSGTTAARHFGQKMAMVCPKCIEMHNWCPRCCGGWLRRMVVHVTVEPMTSLERTASTTQRRPRRRLTCSTSDLHTTSATTSIALFGLFTAWRRMLDWRCWRRSSVIWSTTWTDKPPRQHLQARLQQSWRRASSISLQVAPAVM